MGAPIYTRNQTLASPARTSWCSTLQGIEDHIIHYGHHRTFYVIDIAPDLPEVFHTEYSPCVTSLQTAAQGHILQKTSFHGKI